VGEGAVQGGGCVGVSVSTESAHTCDLR